MKRIALVAQALSNRWLGARCLQRQTLTTTDVAIGSERGWIALFRFADQLKPQATTLPAKLQQLGVTTEILSGDSHGAVAAVAKALKVNRWRATQTPQDKLQHLRRLQQQRGKIVAVVGDGVNDAPVIANATVSIAIGSGADISKSSADMVFHGDDLNRLYEGINLARRTLQIIRQNLLWALSYNAIALPLAATGHIAPWMAAIGMCTSSLVVVLNAIRLSHIDIDQPTHRGKEVMTATLYLLVPIVLTLVAIAVLIFFWAVGLRTIR